MTSLNHPDGSGEPKRSGPGWESAVVVGTLGFWLCVIAGFALRGAAGRGRPRGTTIGSGCRPIEPGSAEAGGYSSASYSRFWPPTGWRPCRPAWVEDAAGHREA